MLLNDSSASFQMHHALHADAAATAAMSNMIVVICCPPVVIYSFRLQFFAQACQSSALSLLLHCAMHG